MLLISKQIINIYNDCSSSLSSWFIKAILAAIYSYPLHVPYKAALRRTLATQFGFLLISIYSSFLARHVARAKRWLERRLGEMAAMNFGSAIEFMILSSRTILEWGNYRKPKSFGFGPPSVSTDFSLSFSLILWR